jgi:tetratricopeptide repeat protein 8
MRFFSRLGTASMLTEPGGPFIQLSRLNVTKYANQQSIAKPLFEYIYYHEHDARYVSFILYYIINEQEAAC